MIWLEVYKGTLGIYEFVALYSYMELQIDTSHNPSMRTHCEATRVHVVHLVYRVAFNFKTF
jgi:hypothetical protein